MIFNYALLLASSYYKTYLICASAKFEYHSLPFSLLSRYFFIPLILYFSSCVSPDPLSLFLTLIFHYLFYTIIISSCLAIIINLI